MQPDLSVRWKIDVSLIYAATMERTLAYEAFCFVVSSFSVGSWRGETGGAQVPTCEDGTGIGRLPVWRPCDGGPEPDVHSNVHTFSGRTIDRETV